MLAGSARTAKAGWAWDPLRPVSEALHPEGALKTTGSNGAPWTQWAGVPHSAIEKAKGQLGIGREGLFLLQTQSESPVAAFWALKVERRTAGEGRHAQDWTTARLEPSRRGPTGSLPLPTPSAITPTQLQPLRNGGLARSPGRMNGPTAPDSCPAITQDLGI